MALEAVIFDWGGTLSSFATVDLADMWRLAARHLDPSREDELCHRLTEVEAATFDRVHSDQRSSTLRDILREASAALDLDVAEAVLEEAATHHLDSWTEHIVHEPDALPVLAWLRDCGLKTGLLSNTHWPRTFHEHFLERDGLEEYLDVRVYTSELTHMKPHPKVFRGVLQSLGVTHPANAVFVGDRLFDDIYGAKMCGLRTVWRRNDTVPRFEVDPDAAIDRLAELVPLIEEWLPG